MEIYPNNPVQDSQLNASIPKSTIRLEEYDTANELQHLKNHLKNLGSKLSQLYVNMLHVPPSVKQDVADKAAEAQRDYNDTKSMIMSLEGIIKDMDALNQVTKSDTDSILDSIPKHMARYDGKSMTARAFLSQFHRCLLPHLGEEKFERQCSRLMLSCITEESSSIQFQEGMNHNTSSPPGWDTCRRVFLCACLTQAQRDEEILRLTQHGRFDKETYQNFAVRIETELRLYGIKDDNNLILTQLEKVIGPDAYNFMLIFHLQTNPNSSSFASLSEFLKQCKKLRGPEGSESDKVFIDHPVHEKRPVQDNQQLRRRPINRPSRGQNRFTPHTRPQDNRGYDRNSNVSFFCDKCGKNPSHTTKDHKSCTYRPCLKIGHKESECRMKQRHMSNDSNGKCLHNNVLTNFNIRTVPNH
ncbi:hypothetical protein BGW38_000896 [Lunasporangiospora selenospora]|uniref:Uncharacterized protein n=1 Tax=Lunasporangiospora selenospora TaxID=979761 RepID=A0A9P6KDW8_9FUNG|nr:hypothetical protein BGW38_000896 [Lunasporangiospora selenospora]